MLVFVCVLLIGMNVFFNFFFVYNNDNNSDDNYNIYL